MSALQAAYPVCEAEAEAEADADAEADAEADADDSARRASHYRRMVRLS